MNVIDVKSHENKTQKQNINYCGFNNTFPPSYEF